MECILSGCEEEVAPGRMWFCESHYEEAKTWWRGKLGHNAYLGTVALARALQKIGTTVEPLIQAIEAPGYYAEEAYWLWTRDQHKDMVVAGTTVATRAVKGAPQQLAGAYLVQECGCGGDDCRR